MSTILSFCEFGSGVPAQFAKTQNRTTTQFKHTHTTTCTKHNISWRPDGLTTHSIGCTMQMTRMQSTGSTITASKHQSCKRTAAQSHHYCSAQIESQLCALRFAYAVPSWRLQYKVTTDQYKSCTTPHCMVSTHPIASPRLSYMGTSATRLPLLCTDARASCVS